MLGDLLRHRAARLASTAWVQAQALRLILRAQTVGSRPVEAVVGLLLASPLLPTGVSPDVARVAARRAGSLVRRLGLLDSCLTRGLVAGALLADREGVVLHFSPPAVSGGRVLRPGHAWVTLDGANVTDAPGASDAGEAEVEIHALSLRRSPRPS